MLYLLKWGLVKQVPSEDPWDILGFRSETVIDCEIFGVRVQS